MNVSYFRIGRIVAPGTAYRVAAIGLCLAAVLGCATDPARHGRPAQLVSDDARSEFTLTKDVSMQLPSGLRVRRLIAGSRWRRVGTVEGQGAYRPVGGVLQVKAGNTYEAMLLASEDQATGVYLPVEDLVVAAKRPVPCSWEETK